MYPASRVGDGPKFSVTPGSPALSVAIPSRVAAVGRRKRQGHSRRRDFRQGREEERHPEKHPHRIATIKHAPWTWSIEPKRAFASRSERERAYAKRAFKVGRRMACHD